ncbi:hypothetical protein B0H14DRAFT_2922666 [Mycena olivaceomarginata]|nr:hypothetical protein B0H14DRAFT_2922666 [Mycena olivaceomarginata]
MSTSTSPTLHKFFVYAPDKTDPEAFAHLEGAKKPIVDGFIRVGGALLTPESLLSDNKKMKAIESDIYYTSGWDPERIAILPFVAATPFP